MLLRQVTEDERKTMNTKNTQGHATPEAFLLRQIGEDATDWAKSMPQIGRNNDRRIKGYGSAGKWIEANSGILSAAPELLESLQALFKECAMIHKVWGDESNKDAADAAIARAKAAIAKAIGKN